MRQITIRSYETKNSVITPIIFLIIGLLLFINPGNIVEFISYIFGGVFLALGIGKFLLDYNRNMRTTGDVFYSLIMVLLGIIFIFFSGTIEFVIRLMIGIWIIINALKVVAVGINMIQVDKKACISLAIGIILLIMGIYTIFVSNLVLSTLGLVITIYASLELVNYFYVLIKNR